MEKFQPFWKRIPHKIRQCIVLVVGIVVIGVGIILIPLPGPGWLIVFVGLAILATEFEIADRWKKHVQHRVRQATELAASKTKRLRKK